MGASLTRGAVVAHNVVGGVAKDGASRALDDGAADLLRVLPDELGEVADLTEVDTGGGVGGAVVVVVLDLGVPLVGNGVAKSLLVGAEGAGRTVASNVLAVAAATLVPRTIVSR